MITLNQKPDFSFLTFFFIGLVVDVSFAQPISIDQAIAIAMKSNDKILQYQQRDLQRSFDTKNAQGSFLPSITLTGSYNYLNAPLTMDLDPIRDVVLQTQSITQVNFASIASQMNGGAALSDPASPTYQAVYQKAYSALDNQIPHFIDTLKKQQYPSAAVTAVLPVFTGGRIIAASRAAQADKKAADFELCKIKNEVLQETVNNYLSIALLKKVAAVRTDVLAGMEQHKRNAEKLAEQGVIAKYHLLRALVAVSDAQRNIDDDKSKLSMAYLALKKSLNIPYANEIEVADTLTYFPCNDSLDIFLNYAKSHQPVFSMLMEKRRMAHQKVVAQRGAMLPQVALYGRAELFTDYLSALEPPWVVGINASLPIFTGGKNVTSYQSAKHLEEEAAIIDSAVHNDIDLWINKAYHDLRTSQQRYANLNADQNLANENLRQCQSRFENGYGTSLEVIDAQLVVEKNRIDRLVSLYDYCKAINELYTASGQSESVVAFLHGKGE